MLRALLLASLSAALSAGSAAQIALDPCRPAVTAGPVPVGELAASAFGVAEVGQLCLVPRPSGGFEGMASVRATPSSLSFEVRHFTWAGPGANPVPTNLAAALDGPGQEFQASLDRTGLAVVFDTDASHPVGAGRASVATRNAVGQPFGQVRALSGIPAGAIDPALGRRHGRDVLFFVAAPGTIRVGDVDLAPASATYGHVTNVRDAVAGAAVPGLLTLHSPTPWPDGSGETIGLLLGAWVAGTGSDAWFQSAAELADFPVASATGRLLFALDEHGADWLGNPAVVRGTSIWARGLGDRYLVPERYDFFALSSASVPAIGGTARHVARLPLEAGGPFLGVVQLGVRTPTPFDPSAFGFAGAGFLCVAPLVNSPGGAFVQDELAVSFVIPPAPPGATVDVECIAIDPGTGRLWISNVAVLEVRP